MAAKEKVSDLQTLLGYKTYHETLWIFHNYHPQCFIIVTKRYNPHLVGLFLKWYTSVWYKIFSKFYCISCIYIKEEFNEIVSLMKKIFLRLWSLRFKYIFSFVTLWLVKNTTRKICPIHFPITAFYVFSFMKMLPLCNR